MKYKRSIELRQFFEKKYQQQQNDLIELSTKLSQALQKIQLKDDEIAQLEHGIEIKTQEVHLM